MAGKPPSDLDRRIGGRLLAERRGAGLSQRALAAVLGLSAAQLHKYEQGHNRITAAHLFLAAGRLGLPVAAFFDPPPAADATPPVSFAHAREALLAAALAVSAAHARAHPPRRRPHSATAAA